MSVESRSTGRDGVAPWDRPQWLNTVADVLFAAAAILAGYAAILFAIRLPVFPLREIRVDGKIAHVTRADIESVARHGLTGNFLTLDLAAARAAFTGLPWVKKVDVRREWPDRLDVTIEEHVPLARWGERGLVDAQGEVFKANYDGELPLFAGPSDAAKEIAAQYEYFRRRLAAINKVPEQVLVSQRRAWQIRLDDGMTLELGREEVEKRLARFVAVYDRTVGQLGRRIDYVDLRYANGFAVRIPGLGSGKAGSRRRKGAA